MRVDIQNKNLLEILTKAGYKQHYITDGSFVTETYIRERDKQSRFHFLFQKSDIALLKKDRGQIHIDLYKQGKHKTFTGKEVKKIIQREIGYIKSFEEQPPPPLQTPPKKVKEKSSFPKKGIFAPDWQQLTKRTVIVRKWYNPMRYLKGKFIYKNN